VLRRIHRHDWDAPLVKTEGVASRASRTQAWVRTRLLILMDRQELRLQQSLGLIFLFNSLGVRISTRLSTDNHSRPLVLVSAPPRLAAGTRSFAL
jgi:hypothetical protein